MRAVRILVHFLPQPLVAMLALPAAVVLAERALLDPAPELSLGAFRWTGVAIIALGVAVEVWCAETFLHYGVTWDYFDPPRRLVTSGPYRLSRHPVYVGGMMIVLGEAISFGSMGLFAYLILYVLITDRLFIALIEEPTLVRQFGEEYARYRSSVRRYL